MPTKESVINNVQVLRKTVGQTQEELAEAISVTRQTIIAIERGNYAPSVVLAIKIARHFDVSVEDVFSL